MKKANATESKMEMVEVTSSKCIGARQFKNGDVTIDVEINGIRIYGVRVVEGKKGDFLSFPQRAGKDGKYYSIVWCPLAQEEQDKLIKEAEEIITSK